MSFSDRPAHLSPSSPDLPPTTWPTAAWQRYLPPDFGPVPSDIPARWPEPDRQRILDHLRAVWQAVQTYLPRRVMRRLLGGLEPGAMWSQIAHGTFLFADISGFTALADRLSVLPDGTEQVTELINGHFSAMLRLVHQSCQEMLGSQAQAADEAFDLLKFGGDAMLLLFAGPDHARLAVHAAIRMQQHMAQMAKQASAPGAETLHLHIGINSGRFLDAHAGTARLMKKIEVGHTLNLTARAEEFAGPDQIALGPATCHAVRDHIALQPIADGFSLVPQAAWDTSGRGLSVSEQTEPTPQPPGTLDELAAALDATLPYLMPGLLDKIILEPNSPVVWADLKPVTVLFANLLGISEMLDALDAARAAEVTAILDRYLGAVSEIVSRYDGTFNKMDLAQQGDKLLILFGAPHAHEDDPQRAVRAALDMQEALRPFTDLSTPWGQCSLRLRVGIHSGNVFAGNVGSPERKEYTVMGDTVNLAARLMMVAEPGQVLVSQETQQRLGPNFACQALPPLHLKGKPEPVLACQVTGLRQEGFATRRAARHSPLIGRDAEMATLKAAAGRVLGGEGQVVSIVGDAGMGKSRLVDELAAHAESLGMQVLRGSCVSYGSAMAYLPWIELLQGFLGWAGDDTPAQRQEKLEHSLAAIDRSLVNWAPVVAGVLGFSVPETPLTQSLDARLRKERFFAIVSQVLETRASESPLLLVFEDLHWADPISLELLAYTARNLGDSPILLVGVRRPEGAQPQWDNLPHHQVIHLGELGPDQSRQLASSLLRTSDLPPALESLILDRAQGNPFYLEEVTRMLIDRGHLVVENGGYRLGGDASAIEIPETINGVVMSRIDSLDEGSRTVLRVASVIGRVFAYQPLKAIYPQPIGHEALRRRLEALRQVDLTPLEEPEPNLRYIFKHILTQQVAYESLLHARRRELHGQVAFYYEQSYSKSGLEEYYDLLAFHFRRSEHRQKALEYATHAGDRARAAYANDTAIRHYSAALALMSELGQASTPQWAEVQFNLSEVYVLVGRYEEARQGYQAALEAAGAEWSAEQKARTLRKIGMTFESQGQYNEALEWLLQARTAAQSDPASAASRQTARILSDMGAVHMRRAEYQTAITFIEQALALLARLPEDLERLRDEGWAYTRLGVIHVHLGDLVEARKFFETSLTLRQKAGDLPGAATLHNNLGYIAHHLQGDVLAAIASYQRSLHLSHQIGYRHMLAMTANNLGLAYQTLGDYRQAIAYYRQSLQFCQEMGDLRGIASTYDNLGLAYHQQGDYVKSMEYHHLSLEIKRQQQDAFQVANSLVNVAAVCRDQGHLQEAMAFAEEALQTFQEIGGRQFLAESHTVLAEALLLDGQYEQARQHATLALETAQETGSRKDQAIALRVLGETERALGLSGSQDRLRESVTLLEKVGDRFELGKSLRSLGFCLVANNHPTQGEAYLSQAAQIFQELGAQGELKRTAEPQITAL